MFQRLTRSFTLAIVLGGVVLSLAPAAPAEPEKSGMSPTPPLTMTGTVSTVDKKGMATVQTEEGQQHKIKNRGWHVGDKVSCAKKGSSLTCTKAS